MSVLGHFAYRDICDALHAMPLEARHTRGSRARCVALRTENEPHEIYFGSRREGATWVPKGAPRSHYTTAWNFDVDLGARPPATMASKVKRCERSARTLYLVVMSCLVCPPLRRSGAPFRAKVCRFAKCVEPGRRSLPASTRAVSIIGGPPASKVRSPRRVALAGTPPPWAAKRHSQ